MTTYRISAGGAYGADSTDDGTVRAICRVDGGVLVDVEGTSEYAQALRDWMDDEDVTEGRLLGSVNDYFDVIEKIDDVQKGDELGQGIISKIDDE